MAEASGETVGARIIAAIAARLEELAGVAEVAVMPPGDPARFPALHLDDEGESVVMQDQYQTRSTLNLAVVGFVTGAGAHPAARNLDGRVLRALLSAPIPETEYLEAGGLTVEEVVLAEVRAIGFRRSFQVFFSCWTADPTRAAD